MTVPVYRRYVLGLSLLALLGCSQKPAPGIVHTAFYHWKSSPADARSWAVLDSVGAGRVYLRLFDIDWNEGLGAPAPVGALDAKGGQLPEGLEWVPCVFLTNRSLMQTPIQRAGRLAEQIVERVLADVARLQLEEVPEVQLDCDWTGSTQEAYFSLVARCRELLSASGIRLSVTVRLHQLRYPEQAGVPPADRGMLMFYNMGEVRSWEEPNSILNLDAAAPYLGSGAYALPLDLALPVFAWGVLFRDGELARLLHGLKADDLADRSRFFPMGGNRFEVVQGTFLQGHYLYEGDLIRLEAAAPDDLLKAAATLRSYPWPSPVYLAFYHLGEEASGGYPASLLNELSGALQE